MGQEDEDHHADTLSNMEDFMPQAPAQFPGHQPIEQQHHQPIQQQNAQPIERPVQQIIQLPSQHGIQLEVPQVAEAHSGWDDVPFSECGYFAAGG